MIRPCLYLGWKTAFERQRNCDDIASRLRTDGHQRQVTDHQGRGVTAVSDLGRITVCLLMFLGMK